MVAERGDFALFALFLRKGAPGTWDLVASAPWLDPDSIESLKYIYIKIGEVYSPEEIARISRVVLLDPASAAVRAFLDVVAGKTGAVRLRNFTFDNTPIRRGYIIAANLPAAVGAQRIRKSRPRVDG